MYPQGAGFEMEQPRLKLTPTRNASIAGGSHLILYATKPTRLFIWIGSIVGPLLALISY